MDITMLQILKWVTGLQKSPAPDRPVRSYMAPDTLSLTHLPPDPQTRGNQRAGGWGVVEGDLKLDLGQVLVLPFPVGGFQTCLVSSA